MIFIFSLCDEATRDVASEGVADGVGKVASEVVGVEVAYVHHGGVVFAREPTVLSPFHYESALR